MSFPVRVHEPLARTWYRPAIDMGLAQDHKEDSRAICHNIVEKTYRVSVILEATLKDSRLSRWRLGANLEAYNRSTSNFRRCGLTRPLGKIGVRGDPDSVSRTRHFFSTMSW